jgi:hypothetical protein
MDIFQIKNSSMNLSLTGAAGAATGFARTFPMRDEQDSEAGLRK